MRSNSSPGDTGTAMAGAPAGGTTGSGTPGTAFAGKGQGGGDAVVGATTALANGGSPLVASSIAMTITKSATVLDPYGTAKAIPGAIVTFQARTSSAWVVGSPAAVCVACALPQSICTTGRPSSACMGAR